MKREKGQGLKSEFLTGAGGKYGVPKDWVHTQYFFIGGANGKVTLCEPYDQPGGKMNAATMRGFIPKLPYAISKAWGGKRAPAGGWIVFQDNDSGQTNKSLDGLYARHHVDYKSVEAPANSGDLRWIENWWKRMRERILKSDPGPHETKEEFIKRATKIVFSTPRRDLVQHAQSMPDRIKACIANEGGRVPY